MFLNLPFVFIFQLEVLYDSGGMLVHLVHDVISETDIKLLQSRAEQQVHDDNPIVENWQNGQSRLTAMAEYPFLSRRPVL